MQNKTDEQLMALVHQGHQKAFEQLYDRYFKRLVFFASRLIENVQKSEDVVQEVFIKIIEDPERFDGNKKFSTWVYTVTGNACKNVIRDEQNRERLLKLNMVQDEAGTLSVYPKMDEQVLQQRIGEVYKLLSEKEKMIYVLRFEQELSIKEIAAIADIPEGSVKSCIYYLLKKFNLHLKEFKYE